MSEAEELNRVPPTPVTAIGTRVIHPNRENLAFGRFALPVLTQQIQDPDSFLRRRAMQTLCDHVFNPKNVACTSFSDIIPTLRKVINDEDSNVRMKVAECFSVITTSPAGRQSFVKHSLLSETIVMLDDHDENIRKSANIVLQRAALSQEGAEAILSAKLIPKLVEKLSVESDDIKIIILETLHSCCRIDSDQALYNRGMEVLIPLLKNFSPEIRAKTANVIMDLSVDAKGRNKACDANAISPLLDLCSDDFVQVRANALAATMMIANATPGRFMSIERDAITRLIPLLRDNEKTIRLNCLQVLTALSEAPTGRAELLRVLDQVSPLMYDKVPEVKRAATKAVKVIKWRP